MGVEEFTVLDIETTGLSKYMHKITEIAAVKIKGKKIIGRYQTLVNPEEPIPGFITRLTGINDEMVKDAPKIQSVLPEFLDFLGSSTIIAHNATFDYGFINYNMEKHLDLSLENDKICTRRLANRLLPDLPSKRLKHLCETFEIENVQAHRAMSDVNATLEVFKKFCLLLELADIKSKEDIMKFQSNKIERNFLD